MDITGFTKFLDEQSLITSKEKAVRSRVSKAAKVEIQNKMNEHKGNYQNAVRKYYEYQNKQKFPKLSNFRSLK